MKIPFKTILCACAFLIGGVIFQISCSNDQNSSSVAQISKVVFVKGVGAGQTIWVCDYDGSNLVQVPVTLPANVELNSTNGMPVRGFHLMGKSYLSRHITAVTVLLGFTPVISAAQMVSKSIIPDRRQP